MRRLLTLLLLALALIGAAQARTIFHRHGGGGIPSAPPPNIASVALSNNTVACASVGQGSVVGTLTTTMTSGSFTGSNSVTGPDAAKFSVVGGNLQIAQTLTCGQSYNINIVPTQIGATCSIPNCAQPEQIAVTAPTLTISSISLSGTSFVGGSPSGTIIGNATVTMSDGSTFAGSLSVGDTTHFQFASRTLETSGVVASGLYPTQACATQGNATNSPFCQSVTLVGNSSGGSGNCATGATADACVVFAPSTNTLVATGDSSATWSFGVAHTSVGNFHLLRNGVDTGGVAAEILLANGGRVYVKGGPGDTGGGQNTWFLWNGSGYTAFQFPPITLVAGSTALNSIAPNSGLVALGITAPSDTMYANASLIITVDLVPANGTVYLSDGVTAVVAGQNLNLAQLTGLKFKPTTGVSSWASSFAYHVTDPATVMALGDVALNVTAGTALWADPPGAATPSAGVLAAPTVTQPSVAGDVVGLRVQNPAGFTEAAGYVTHGHLFLPGAVQPSDTIIGRLVAPGGTSIYVQMDVKSTHADGSVRWAMMTYKAPSLAGSATQDVVFAKCTSSCPAAPSPVAPTAAAISNGSWAANTTYDLNSSITFTSGETGAPTPSCRTILANAVAGGQVMTLNSGPALTEYAAIATFGASNRLKVECDIRAYADGTTSTMVNQDNGWFFASGKADLVYNISFTQDGFSANGVKHYLYSNWAHQINSAGIISPNIQYDVPYLMATGATPFIDPTFGVLDSQVSGDFAQISTVPMNTALFTTRMGAEGGRQDLAPIPQWMARWLMSQDNRARQVMMFMANAGGTFPIRYIDESVNAPFGEPVNPVTYPNIGYATLPVPGGGGSQGGFNCGGNTPCPNGNIWVMDSAHEPDASYFACLTTGLRFYCQNFKAQADWNIFGVVAYGTTVDYVQQVPTGYLSTYINILPSNPNFGNPSNNNINGGGQVRSMAWDTRQIGEAAYLLPDTDPLKTTIVNELTKGLRGAAQLYVLDDYNSVYGQFDGMLAGYFGGLSPEIGTHYIPPWENNFSSIELGVVANMGIPTASALARRILNYQSPLLTGLVLNGAAGYDPVNGAPYKLFNLGGLNAEAGKPAITTWAQLYNNSYVGADNGGQTWPGPGALGIPSRLQNQAVFGQIDLITFGGQAYPNGQGGAMGGYPNINRAGEAMRISHLAGPSNFHSYAFLTSWIRQNYNGADFATDVRWMPAFNSVPRLPDGTWMFANRFFLDTSGAGTVTLTATPGPSVIGVVGPGTATLTGEDVGPMDTFLCDAGPCTVNPGHANAYVTGACGAMTYNDNIGTNDVLVNDCGAGQRGNGNGTAANLKFTTPGAGTTTIRGFRPGTDKFSVKSALGGTGPTTQGQVISQCSGGSCPLGSGNKTVVFVGAAPTTSDVVIIP